MRNKTTVKIIKKKYFENRFKKGINPLPVNAYTYAFVECHFEEKLWDTLKNYYNDSSFVNCTIGNDHIKYRLPVSEYKLYFD